MQQEKYATPNIQKLNHPNPLHTPRPLILFIANTGPM